MNTLVTIRCPSRLHTVGDISLERKMRWVRLEPDSDDAFHRQKPTPQLLELQNDRRFTRCPDCDIDVRLEVDMRRARMLANEPRTGGQVQTMEATAAPPTSD